MNGHGELPDERAKRARFGRRALAGFAIMLALVLAVAGRFVYLQVHEHAEYSTRAKANRVRLRHLPPPRGLIYDREGKLLADNIPAFRLDVIPDKVQHMDAMLQRLAMVVPLTDDDIRRFKQGLRQHRTFEQVPLKFRLTESERDRFAVDQWQFPGVSVDPYLTRNYPYGAEFAHVTGYVGRIDEKEQARLDPDRYAGTTHVGKTGLEKQYEDLLHGTPGYELVEVNADQRPLRVLQRVPAKPGRNLYLTIDERLQRATITAFAGQTGAAVAIDPRNGNVLAMVTVPSFDPNLFVNGISQADYSALLDDPEKPLLNRAMRGGYPPGSTVKPFIGLGGLELGLRKPDDTVLSTGTFYIPGVARGYRDDQRYGAGRVNLMQAITQSVNTYFYSLALQMGIGRLDQWMAKFGFGSPTGIDLPDETGGVLPSPEWKRKTFKQPWYPGETVISGIGQGYWMVTPMQMAHALASLADGGRSYTPHLLAATSEGLETPETPYPQAPPRQLTHDPADIAAVMQGMLGVVNSPLGTAYKAGIGKDFPYLIAGKTGTAERYSRTSEAYNTNRNAQYLAERHRAWFICFAPADHPQIAIAVVLERGAWGGSAAAPIARKMLDQWLADTPPSDRPPPITTPATQTAAAPITP
ncbi:MAG: penicillin-binding protein 2 [Xanthomonadales bacterium]|nr:penicillin-binding protein 2 [Xanthomonadales bacterium]ODU91698.1 MAG: penicillin-binding protein 2 [Rhodanobacter sp. SCN 66-43]OJY85029.1 MAG: penicillin-binding protein 2 [Xanthomonadales bacterium 66-474]